MKKLVGVIMGWLMFFLLLDIAPLQAREEVDGYFTVTGVVRNKDDRKKLENVKDRKNTRLNSSHGYI